MDNESLGNIIVAVIVGMITVGGYLLYQYSQRQSFIQSTKHLPKQFIQFMLEGDELNDSGQLIKAIEKYEEALKHHNKAPNTKYKLAQLYAQQNIVDESLKYASGAVADGFTGCKKRMKLDPKFKKIRKTEQFVRFINS